MSVKEKVKTGFKMLPVYMPEAPVQEVLPPEPVLLRRFQVMEKYEQSKNKGFLSKELGVLPISQLDKAPAGSRFVTFSPDYYDRQNLSYEGTMDNTDAVREAVRHPGCGTAPTHFVPIQ